MTNTKIRAFARFFFHCSFLNYPMSNKTLGKTLSTLGMVTTCTSIVSTPTAIIAVITGGLAAGLASTILVPVIGTGLLFQGTRMMRNSK